MKFFMRASCINLILSASIVSISFLFTPSVFATTTNESFISNDSLEKRFEDMLNTITPDKNSALQQRLITEKKHSESGYGVFLFEPTYLLPYYNTTKPYHAIYQGMTPNNQTIRAQELKGKMSFKIPLWVNMFDRPLSLNASYTQLNFWQVYAASQYFRETNYEPALFLSDNFQKNWLGSIGVVHESNGRGGELERSWNRAFFELTFSGENWLIDIKPWVLIFKNVSSDVHNPDISNFLGYGRVVLAYKFYHQELSFMFRNAFESKFKRGAMEASYAFPIHGIIHGYIQYFSGYGQSLIEYNHYTNAIGVGIILNNWI